MGKTYAKRFGLGLLLLAALSLSGPAGAAVFQEFGGMVVGEAEDYTSRIDVASSPFDSWLVVPDESSGAGTLTGARGDGRYIQSLPDQAGGGGSPTNPPEVRYQMEINTTGTYQLFLRWANNQNVGGGGNSDSIFVDLIEFKDGTSPTYPTAPNVLPDWYELNQNSSTFAWDGGGEPEINAGSALNNPITWDINSPGTYTLRISQREDGSAVDAWVLQLDDHVDPSGIGPLASEPNNSDAFLYYSFESPDTTADDLAADFSGNGRSGALSAVGTGAYSYATDAAPQANGIQSLLLQESSGEPPNTTVDNAAQLTRDFTTAELDVNNDSWTIATWFKQASDSDDYDFIFHLGNGDGFGGGNELHLFVQNGELRLSEYYNGSQNVGIVSPNDSVGLDEWHHAAVVHEAGASMSLFLDGELVAMDTSFGMNLPQGTSTLVVGGHDSPTFRTTRWFDGFLDDFVVWGRALDDWQIAGLADGVYSPLNVSVPEPTTLLIWSLLAGLACGLGWRRRASGR